MKEFVKKHETAIIIILALIIILLCVGIFINMQSQNLSQVEKYQSVFENDVVMSVTLGDENTTENNQQNNVKISKQQAAQIAEEESKKERYQVGETVIQYTAKITSNENEENQINADLTNKVNSYRWNADLEYKNENGEGLNKGQTMWCVRLADPNNIESNIYIYVDAENGNVVGAGMNK